MESGKKVKVSIIVKRVADLQDKELTNSNGDAYLTLNYIKKLLYAVSLKSDEEDKEIVLDFLNAAIFSNEIMANAFAKIGREDLFNEKMATIEAIEQIINQINNNI